ncbi:uncharacterized protein LOC142639650 [Castanea sativa]|uniref:uncharacterized protein LOC142639650 n=1 Tax=Castanea sativa TaxID=21020 RepID=UPI003F65449B
MDDHMQMLSIEEQRTVAQPVEELEEVVLDDSRPKRTTRIGTLTSQSVRRSLATFLKKNQDIFAWSHEDMPGIDPSVMVHWLNDSPSFSPVRQKKRVFTPERDRAIAKEVQKLQEAGFIRKDVLAPDWKKCASLRRRHASEERPRVRPFERPPGDFQHSSVLQNETEPDPSKPGEELFLYLAVSTATISIALMRKENKIQRPVYFTSQALRGAEERYPQMEKLALALVTAARKLKPYFQAHTINVLTDQPLQQAMSSPEAAGRMALWTVELSEFDIRYQPRAAMKGQVVADFIAEFTLTKGQEAEETPIWRIHTDGSSNKHAGGAGVVLHTPEGDRIKCMIRLDFSTTNNEVEYEALIVGLDLAIAAGAKSVIVYSDSQVVTSQVNGSYECKNKRMKRYLEEVKGRTSNLQIKMVQIPREENHDADRLAKATSAEPMIIPNQVLSFVQLSSLLDGASIQEVSGEHCWMTPIMAYLKDCKLPDNKEVARKVKVKAARSLVHKLLRAGYFWPTMQNDANTYVRACNKCQRFENFIRQPMKELTPMTAPWPFAQWGLGPFPTAVRQLKFLVVGIDYFNKWVEAEALATITEKNIQSFVWRNIICRTTARTPTGETPFRLAYGNEAVIPEEVGLTSYSVENYEENKNDEAMRLQLDFVDEVWAAAEQRLAQYQDIMAKHYNSKVRHRDF